MGKLKLYVVGTDSADPETWSPWDELKLVIAESEEQAQLLAVGTNDLFYKVHEVKFDKPKLLISESEPNHGADI